MAGVAPEAIVPLPLARPNLRPGEEPRVSRLPGGSLHWILRRSVRSRRLRVTIDPSRGVVVTVPLATRRAWAGPDSEIERFLGESETWLRRHLDRHAAVHAALATRGPLGAPGSLRFRGEIHPVRVERDERTRSEVMRRAGSEGDEIVVRLGARDPREPAALLVPWLTERARRVIEREVARHAPALGVAPSRITLRDPRTRWGSASREGRLMFSWRLVLAPPEALETVVVHELAHLREFGHGPAFWALVASRRVDHLTWRRWLRTHSVELHTAITA